MGKNTQPENEGDVLIQALLQLPLDFTQHLCSRVLASGHLTSITTGLVA